MKHIFFTLFGLFFFLQVSAQTIRPSYLSVYPNKPSYLRIDGIHLIKLDSVDYPYPINHWEGKHLIEAWGPHYIVHSDSIEVFIDSTQNLFLRLQYRTKEFEDYRHKRNRFYTQKIAWYTSLATLWTVDAIATKKQLDKMKKQEEATLFQKDLALEAKANFEEAVSLNSLAAYRDEYNKRMEAYGEAQKEYKRMRNNLILFNTASAVATVGGYYILSKYKLERPIKPETTNPFLAATKTTSKIFITPNQVGLSLTF